MDGLSNRLSVGAGDIDEDPIHIEDEKIHKC